MVPMGKGCGMLIRVGANKIAKPVPSQLNTLPQRDAFWIAFKYRRGLEIFGQAEPADYVYQIRLGAVRTYKLLSNGRRQMGSFHLRRVISSVSRTVKFIDLGPKQSSIPTSGSQSAGAFLQGSPKATFLPRTTSGTWSPKTLSTLKTTSFSWVAKNRWRKLPPFS